MKVLVAQSYSTLLQLHGLYSPPGSSVHGIFSPMIVEWVAIYSSRGIFLTQGSNLHPPTAPVLAGGFFTTKQPGKPRGVMSKPESNPSLPSSAVPCGRIQHHLISPCPPSRAQERLWGSLMYQEPGLVESHRLKDLHGPFC